MSDKEQNLFLDNDFEETKLTDEKVTCLGMEFANEKARRTYFREELRKKLPELKKIEGFPIGEDDDIINLSDPPYYTACPNPWLNDFVEEWEKEKERLEKTGKRNEEIHQQQPYANNVSEGKSNPIYMAHAYHTKVPHPAIMRYILHYTQPGDIIFDGFGGTGMTAVAAGMCENSDNANKGLRHCICSDLSPIASFITYNYNNPQSAGVYKSEFITLIDQAKRKYDYLYETNHANGKKGIISFVIWSEVFTCPNCQSEIIYFDSAVTPESFKLSDNFLCPKCACKLSKKNITKEFDNIIGNNGKLCSCNKLVPVLIKYKYNNKSYYNHADDNDVKLLAKINDTLIENRIPDVVIPEGIKTNELIRNGRINVSDLYTKRNLMVLSYLWEKAIDIPLIRFAITAILVKTGSLLHNVGFKDGKINLAGALPNALFIPSILAERNIFELLEGKVEDIIRMNPASLHKMCNQVQSATDLRNIPSNSIDYIFTDPPFGHNLMYSELNFIHEAWLGVRTENTDEAIESPAQNKSIFSYQKLMEKSFREYYRILKDGKWMTVEFSNTSAAIWNSIQTALKSAGFTISVVRGLDKQQGSFNAQTTSTAVKQDLVISCYKSSVTISIQDGLNNNTDTWKYIDELLTRLPIHQQTNNRTTTVIERSPKILYDRLISYYVQHGYAIPMDAQEFQKGLRDRFIERDGMFFTASQALEYEEKKSHTVGVVPMALFIGSEAEGIEWLKRALDKPQTYSELQPEWMKSMTPTKKGDILPELSEILEENFIKDEDGKWRKPDAEKAADLEIIRNRKLMKEFNLYLEQAQKPKAKRMKDTRLEVLRYGFKECYKQKEYQTIVTVGDHIQESLLQEDEVLLQYYDIAISRI